VDGLGYGERRSDIIVMETSSGKNNEDLEHSRDDILKNVHSSICALETIRRRHPNASFATASNLLPFTPQSICTTVTFFFVKLFLLTLSHTSWIGGTRLLFKLYKKRGSYKEHRKEYELIIR
jgi:hypothetical protein